jgi:class 3 adenylate cyclase
VVPPVRYAHSGDVTIAYQVVGDGPIDLIIGMGDITHLEVIWEGPEFARLLNRLASFARVMVFDKRGVGLSDRVPGPAGGTLEERMDDIRAVMDAAGSRRAVVFGASEAGPMAILFAATHPERTAALVVYGSMVRGGWHEDDPVAINRWPTRAAFDRDITARFVEIRRSWGEPGFEEPGIRVMSPSRVGDTAFRDWLARLNRLGASPSAVIALAQMNHQIDIRNVLPSIHVPTLILHVEGDAAVSVQRGRYLAAHIPGAKYVELPGTDHLGTVADMDLMADEIEEFVTGVRRGPDPDRVLLTVLFTDIVGSSDMVARLGDRAWTNALEVHHAAIRRELARYRGREVNTAGDSFFAVFDGPARAVRCALEAIRSVRPSGIDIRAGLHTGECELTGESVGGIAVHIGSRVAGLADAGEVLVTNTVKDLVAGSGLTFAAVGTRQLKGIPGEWALYRAS